MLVIADHVAAIVRSLATLLLIWTSHHQAISGALEKSQSIEILLEPVSRVQRLHVRLRINSTFFSILLFGLVQSLTLGDCFQPHSRRRSIPLVLPTRERNLFDI